MNGTILTSVLTSVGALTALAVLAILILPSIHKIGPAEVGLVMKRFGRKLPGDNPIAFQGEAGYQAELLMPGLRFKFWPVYAVTKRPWVQVPAGQIGVVFAQVGASLPIGAKSALYHPAFGTFTDLAAFLANGGQKGVQRPVLPPGTLVPVHPVAFLVLTRDEVYGQPMSPDLIGSTDKSGHLSPDVFGLEPHDLELKVIAPEPRGTDGQVLDMIGIVTALEGNPLPSGHIAGRLGGFEDLKVMEAAAQTNAELIEAVLGNKNALHNNYQDFQAFLTNGGHIGLQHDPLQYGAFALNPFLVRVEKVPMLVVRQGEVAVIKAYVGEATRDTSGEEFKFGSLVRPGHRGIWEEPLRTGKYPINPRCYQAEIVPTAILTLNWAEAVSVAHNLDRNLKQIVAKSSEGFVFNIDLQVQIHVPDTMAPRVISIVGTIQNLVNEVLQAAVGNHFRDTLQGMPAIEFIRTRQRVQEKALEHIRMHLAKYMVETKGVYIQDVILPEDMVRVLTQREIANQEIETFKMQKQAQDERVATEHARGTAEMQAQLAQSTVQVDIQRNRADARKAEADGEATYIERLGAAEGSKVKSIGIARGEEVKAVGLARGEEERAVGLARAEAYRKQVEALGQRETAFINLVTQLAQGKNRFVPEILVNGGNGGSMDGLAAALTRWLATARSPQSGAGGEPPVVTGGAAPVS